MASKPPGLRELTEQTQIKMSELLLEEQRLKVRAARAAAEREEMWRDRIAALIAEDEKSMRMPKMPGEA